MANIENSLNDIPNHKNKLKSAGAVGASVLAFAGVAGFSNARSAGHGETVNVPVVIKPHDTIWTAVERADKKMHVSVDPRDEVYRLVDELGTTVVTPGQHITVHVTK